MGMNGGGVSRTKKGPELPGCTPWKSWKVSTKIPAGEKSRTAAMDKGVQFWGTPSPYLTNGPHE